MISEERWSREEWVICACQVDCTIRGREIVVMLKLNEGVMKNSSPLIRLVIKALHECRLKRDRKREREGGFFKIINHSTSLTLSSPPALFPWKQMHGAKLWHLIGQEGVAWEYQIRAWNRIRLICLKFSCQNVPLLINTLQRIWNGCWILPLVLGGRQSI